MQRSKSKKRPISHFKHSKRSLEKITKPQIPYGMKHPNNKHNKDKLKLKPQPVNPKTKNISDYDFPEFAIYSIDQPQEQKILESAVTNKKGSRIKEKSQKNQSSRVNKQDQPSKNMKKGNIKSIESRCQDRLKNKKSDGKSLQFLFQEALKKTFKLLDIFTRGKISEVNINNWIPQFFLYFLGKPIQKIKTQRLTLSESQFVDLCFSVLIDSSPEDLKEFIKEANSTSHLKASVTLTQNGKRQQIKDEEIVSPIKKRMIEEQLQKSNQKSGILKKNSQLDLVLEAIKCREAEIGQKIRQTQQKRKSVTFNNALQEIQPNQLQRSYNISNAKPQQESRGIQVNDFLQQRFSPLSVAKEGSLKSSINVQKSIISDNFFEISRKIEGESPYIANFTFQLPQISEKNQQNIKPKLDYNYQLRRYQEYLQNIISQRQQKNIYQINEKPLSARQVNKSRDEIRSDIISKSSRMNLQRDDLRLDRLKSKIESYMKKNQEKIQKNRSFFLQNSPNKL